MIAWLRQLFKGVGRVRCSGCKRFMGFKLGFRGTSHTWCYPCLAAMFEKDHLPIETWMLEYGGIIEEGP